MTIERPPIYLTFEDGRKETIDNDPEPPEHCGNCHSNLIKELDATS